jgi:hypothetical protein
MKATKDKRLLPEGNWMQPFIAAALRRGLCVQPNCMTCGSRPFKSLLVVLASGGRRDIRDRDLRTIKQIAAGLAQIGPPFEDHTEAEYERAAITTIYFIWSARGFNRHVQPVLTGSWAGKVLAEMQKHYAKQWGYPLGAPCAARVE